MAIVVRCSIVPPDGSSLPQCVLCFIDGSAHFEPKAAAGREFDAVEIEHIAVCSIVSLRADAR